MLKDNSLSFSSGTLEVHLDLGVSCAKVARELFNKELYIYLLCIVLNFFIIVNKEEARVADLMKFDRLNRVVDLQEVVVDNSL